MKNSEKAPNRVFHDFQVLKLVPEEERFYQEKAHIVQLGMKILIFPDGGCK